MRKRLMPFVAAVLVATTVAPATAQAPREEGKARMTTGNVTGTVKAVGADTVVVAGKDRGRATEWTFGLDPKTRIRKGGKDMPAADLKAGDAVAVRYTEHYGKAVALTINVRTAGTAKKPDARPAEKP